MKTSLFDLSVQPGRNWNVEFWLDRMTQGTQLRHVVLEVTHTETDFYSKLNLLVCLIHNWQKEITCFLDWEQMKSICRSLTFIVTIKQCSNIFITAVGQRYLEIDFFGSSDIFVQIFVLYILAAFFNAQLSHWNENPLQTICTAP